MRIAFASPPFSGHLYPMTTLAHAVRMRGHDVVFLGLPDAEPLVRELNFDFLPFGAARFPNGELRRRLRFLSQLNGARGLEYTMCLLAETSRAEFEDGPAILASAEAEGLVSDPFCMGLSVVAKSLAMPFISVSNALHYDLSGEAPLCIFDWPYEDTLAARRHYRRGNRLFARLLAPIVQAQREYAERAGFDLHPGHEGVRVSPLAHLTQTPREFDFPARHYPAHFHHTGPFHHSNLRRGRSFPWERLTGQPLIYASLGTLQNGSKAIFQTIIQALQSPDRQLVLSVGGNLDPSEVGQVAESTVVLNDVPQLELLKRTSVCVTHGGLNTALECLANGVPMVAIPITNDQPGVASRIQYTGTGVVVPLKQLAVGTLRAAVQQVFANPSFRQNAQRLRQAIERANGLETAAMIIENTLREAAFQPDTSTTSTVLPRLTQASTVAPAEAS